MMIHSLFPLSGRKKHIKIVRCLFFYWSKICKIMFPLLSMNICAICSVWLPIAPSGCFKPQTYSKVCVPNTGSDLKASQLRSGHLGIPSPCKISGVLGENVIFI